MSPPVLSVRGVTRSHAGRAVVSDATFEVDAGRIACLLGPSGCGKSTLLRMIAGLESVDGGEIRLDGHVVSRPHRIVAPERRSVGMVFQDFALFPHLDVTGNVAFGLTQLPPAVRRRRALELLARFHVERLADAWPHTLSGGEQQRVAIARALAREPALLLLDEPFSGLDETLRATVRHAVIADLRAAGTAVLMVTHDPEEALLAADHLILMSCGRILQTGSPRTCYHHPASIEAAHLLGDAVILPANVARAVATTAFGRLPAPSIPDGAARVMVRPEGFLLGTDGVPATVAETGFGGAYHLVTLVADGCCATVRMSTPPPDTGTVVHVSIDPRSASVYAA